MGKLVLTCGDPAGVGPEIVHRFILEHPEQRAELLVAGPPVWLSTLEGVTGIPVGPDDYLGKPGEPDQVGARVAWEALEAAANACLDGRATGVVTAPISKAAMQAVGFRWPGHTEFFADRWPGTPVMAFSGPSLKVSLATWHIPLGEVIPALEKDTGRIFRAVEALHDYLVGQGKETPKIGLCGLNPHAGEGGMLGREESGWLQPVVQSLAERFPGFSGPWPADTVFWRARKGDFDGVVSLYHDQGLIAVKTLEMDEAVNLTLGLKFIRTSPDHGTAFDIAGRGVADGRSFSRAVAEAWR